MRRRLIVLAVMSMGLGAITSNAVADDPNTRDYRVDVMGTPIKLACVNGPDDIFYTRIAGIDTSNGVDDLGATVDQAPNWVAGPSDIAGTMEKISDRVFVERDATGEVTFAIAAEEFEGRFAFTTVVACDADDLNQ